MSSPCSTFEGYEDADLLIRPWTRRVNPFSFDSFSFYLTYDVYVLKICEGNFGLFAAKKFSKGDIICEVDEMVTYEYARPRVVNGDAHIHEFVIWKDNVPHQEKKFFNVGNSPIWLLNSAQPGGLHVQGEQANCFFNAFQRKHKPILQLVAFRSIPCHAQLLEMYDATDDEL